MNDMESLALSDVIDIDRLQQLQDTFFTGDRTRLDDHRSPGGTSDTAQWFL